MTITVKLISPRDYEITKDGAIITVRANRILDDEVLGKPLQEYEEILKFIENFEIIPKETIKPEIPEKEAKEIKTQIDGILYPKSVSVDSPSQNIQAYNEGLRELVDKDISRIKEKYTKNYHEFIPKPTYKPALAVKQMQVHGLISSHEAAKLQKQFNSEDSNKSNSQEVPHIAGIPTPIKRQEMILRNLKEFTSEDIVEFFGKMGYDRHRIQNNVGHDLKALKRTNKIKIIGNNPRKWGVIGKKKGSEIAWP